MYFRKTLYSLQIKTSPEEGWKEQGADKLAQSATGT